MQKCLGGPSGTSPITLSARMEEVIRRRKCVEEGIRTDAHLDGVDEMIYSNYFDLGMVMDYWGPERLNHHTEATSALFGARECARLILQEGLDRGSPGISCMAMRCSKAFRRWGWRPLAT
jgi:(S)-ureidoglycine-glyoxylate aminotransferase